MIPHGNMPNKGDLFNGEINDLFLIDGKNWRRRDIWFYKKELIDNRGYDYPQRQFVIVLLDTEGNQYECRFSKPDNEKRVCLGTPGKLKKWYQKKGYSDDHVPTIMRDGYKDKVFFEYTGDNNKFIILTEKEFKSKHPAVLF
jgi:hypothetical protein